VNTEKAEHWGGALNKYPTTRDAGATLVAGRFVAQDRRPSQLDDADVAAMPPLLRTLLATDATITGLIEAYSLRPLILDVVSEDAVELDEWLARWLDAANGIACLRRRVAFHSGRAGDPSYCAQTHLLPTRLPEQLQERLRVEPRGVGETLRQFHTETFRELLWYGLQDTPGWAVEFVPPGRTLRRTYRIHVRGAVALLVDEYFCRTGPLQ